MDAPDSRAPAPFFPSRCSLLQSVTQVATANPATLSHDPQDRPRLANGAAVTPVLVRLAQLTALVLPMR
ncbi:hypothetical protein GCM10025872_13180 [Barrientosiimonas endolithica]|uniref:Uncharacterized protein n=1 Tax=Barrientosiimonas endolithica TaxID=1535208 RepID=A0ABN6YNQ5_9MICO|nr:hypothetical protein GCM10025872_13180 [Barrientosiimonas endolithica]